MAKFIKPKMIRIQNSLSFDMIKIPNKDYEMGKYPITIAEYMHFAKVSEKHLPQWKKELGDYVKMNLTDNAPIIGVNWYDAVAFCKWLNEQQKEYIYRLPTEDEWEYTCRVRTTTDWSFGDNEKELKKYAWYDDNSNGITHVVGEKVPNDWKLFDMHGNVWEWCENWYNEKENEKVLRGGSWFNNANYTHSVSRSRSFPSIKSSVVGFRLLRTSP